MLSQLHGHVEQQESQWSQHAADLQQQLDEARQHLDDQNVQNDYEENDVATAEVGK